MQHIAQLRDSIVVKSLRSESNDRGFKSSFRWLFWVFSVSRPHQREHVVIPRKLSQHWKFDTAFRGRSSMRSPNQSEPFRSPILAVMSGGGVTNINAFQRKYRTLLHDSILILKKCSTHWPTKNYCLCCLQLELEETFLHGFQIFWPDVFSMSR